LARIVAAVASTHNPLIFWGKVFNKEILDRAYAPIRKLISETDPDVVLVVANDHLDTFFFDNMPAFAIGTGQRVTGPFPGEKEAGIPQAEYNIQQEVAYDILRKGMNGGVDFSFTQSCRIDHAFVVPLLMTLPLRERPIVPVFTNCFADPIPEIRRFYQVGQVIRSILDGRPADEKVAILASFNYSVEVGGPKMGRRDEGFDQLAEQYLIDGEVNKVLDGFSVSRLLEAGNSTAEYLNYITLLGALDRSKPDLYTDFKPTGTSHKCPLAAWDLR
jgi:protocatechuate 4,5-dioxygenase beta chain